MSNSNNLNKFWVVIFTSIKFTKQQWVSEWLSYWQAFPMIGLGSDKNDYNPHIIYDASCLAKEYGYNRELRRFMKLTITTDRFHQCNHSTCSNSFKSSEYSALNNVNSEACEQVNALLRKISSSTTYMSPKMYIKAITLFLADQNFNSKRRK